jgi:hypothetical protein
LFAIKKYHSAYYLVRSYRSNPALKQDLQKARFLESKISNRGINSEAVMPRKWKSGAVFYFITLGQPK